MTTPQWRLAPAIGLVLATVCLWSLLPGVTVAQPAPPTAAAPDGISPQAQQRIASSLQEAIRLVQQYGAEKASTMVTRTVRLQRSGALEVYIHLHTFTPEHLQTLAQHGARVQRSHEPSRVVYATLPIEALETVATLPFVRWVSPPSFGVRRTGSVTSEGDRVMRADQVRTTLGMTGRGVRVGIISDSLVNLQASVQSGNLPADVRIVNNQNGNSPEATDEGRAMAEIIHDLAPGATLLFHTGFPTSLDFISAVEALTDAGADVIVDDLGFLEQPVFEDGSIAQAVQAAMQRGVVYVSAAGNSADEHYQAPYQAFVAGATGAASDLHDFGNGDARLDLRVAANGILLAFLQWPNPFDASANTADYDLFVVDTNGNTLAASIDRQLSGMAPPMEVVAFRNTQGQGVNVGLEIRRLAGEALPLSLYFSGAVVVREHNMTSRSVFGHPCVRDALAVGAIDVQDPGFMVSETFSSQGPCEIFFPTREVRLKPDVAAADGVSTSVEGFAPFFGTSASAPHVAAVVALLIEAAGGRGALTNTQIANTLRRAAVPATPAGVDQHVGFGVVDALRAVQAVQALQAGINTPPESVIESPAEDVTLPPNTVFTVQGGCVDAENQRPFTFAWDLGGAAPPTTAQSPGPITFPTAGSFTLTFTCTDATGQSDPTPARRTVLINNPPDSRITSPTRDMTLHEGESLTFAGTCNDLDNHAPFTFQWSFGSGANMSSSALQNPGPVRFDTPGTFTVAFTCIDTLGTPDPAPGAVQVIVQAREQRSAGNDDGGGGGCTLLPGGQRPSWRPLAALDHAVLPMLGLWIVRAWSRRRAR